MSPPWMPLYIADYRADTAHLSAAEHGAYLLLIMQYWQRERLPDDDRQLARIASMTDREWKGAKPVLAALFQPGWKHKRIDAELQKAAATISKRRAAAEQMHANRLRGRDAHAHANASASAGARHGAGHDIRAGTPSPPPQEDKLPEGERARRATPTRGARIPDDFAFAEKTRSVGHEEGLTDADIDREQRRFIDHFRAAPGERGRKLDWQATGCNWLRRAAEHRSGARTPTRGRSESTGADAVAAVMARRAAGRDLAGPGWQLDLDAVAEDPSVQDAD